MKAQDFPPRALQVRAIRMTRLLSFPCYWLLPTKLALSPSVHPIKLFRSLPASAC